MLGWEWVGVLKLWLGGGLMGASRLGVGLGDVWSVVGLSVASLVGSLVRSWFVGCWVGSGLVG